MYKATERYSGVFLESSSVVDIFAGHISDAEDCGGNHHGSARRGIGSGVYGDEGWRFVVLHEFEQMGVVDVVRVESELGFEVVSHGLIVERRVRSYSSAGGWGHAAQERGMVGPVAFWAGMRLEV